MNYIRMTQEPNGQMLEQLFKNHTGTPPSTIHRILTGSGSGRIYYRLADGNNSVIGTINHNRKENEAFLFLTRHFASHGLPVPRVFGVSDDRCVYIQEDFGKMSLCDHLGNPENHHNRESLLQEALMHLYGFQVRSAADLDFARCYPQPFFDKQAARWDLHYFKYMFLKPLVDEIDELTLDEAFEALLDHLFEDAFAGFMYRDFQSRNMMLQHQRLWFIDYQGGRCGPLLYDVATLLYHTRLALPDELRDRLTAFYGEVLAETFPVNQHLIAQQVHDFALLRLLQTLGAYGYRGVYQRKEAFVKPIGKALQNTLAVLDKMSPELPVQALKDVLTRLTPRFADAGKSENGLVITLNSFSYMYGLPTDDSGHGGGFVFDCRSLPNPHYETHLRPLTGEDAPIQQWLSEQTEVSEFLRYTEAIVVNAAEKYLDRGFDRLQVNFGCTGGKHRSVFCVEALADRLKKRGIRCDVLKNHLMLNHAQ